MGANCRTAIEEDVDLVGWIKAVRSQLGGQRSARKEDQWQMEDVYRLCELE